MNVITFHLVSDSPSMSSKQKKRKKQMKEFYDSAVSNHNLFKINPLSNAVYLLPYFLFCVGWCFSDTCAIFAYFMPRLTIKHGKNVLVTTSMNKVDKFGNVFSHLFV